MRIRFNKNFHLLIKDFVIVIKERIVKVFAILGAFLTTAKLLENTFLKNYIENSQYLHSIGLTLGEFSLILFLFFLLYVVVSFQNTIINSRFEEIAHLIEENAGTSLDKRPNKYKYNLITRKRAKIIRLSSWGILGPLIIFLSIRLTINNDDCNSKFGKFGIKICQFSDSYEKGGDEDEITVYINNSLSQEINNDTVEVQKVLNQIKDSGIKRSIAEHHLECFDKGIFVYGYRSSAQNTFFCNLYLKNLKNIYNKVKTSHGIIVLDDPKLISLKEVYKGKYISDFILGLYYYYNKEYSKAKDKFNSLNSAPLPNQMSAYSNLYLGYSKLLMKDTSGFSNLHLAEKLDPYNSYAKVIESEEKRNYGQVDTLIHLKKTTITKLLQWPVAVVSIDKMNILYIGTENSISVLANGFLPNKIKIALDSGFISGSNGCYKLTVKKPGIDTLRIIAKDEYGVSKELYKKAFIVKYVVDPKVILADKSTGNVNIKNLQVQDRLYLNTDLEDLPYNIKFKITNFTMIILMPKTDAIALTGNSNRLSKDMKLALGNIKSGSTIILDDIIVKDNSGNLHMINSTVLKTN